MKEHLLEKLFAEVKKERENSSPIARIDCNPKFYPELLNFIMHRGIRPKVSKIARKSLDTIRIVKVASQKAPYKIVRSKEEKKTVEKKGLLKFIEERIRYLSPIGGKICPKCGYVLEKPTYSIERKALAQSITKEIGSKSKRIEEVIYDILSDLEVTGDSKVDACKIVDEISAELLVRYLE